MPMTPEEKKAKQAEYSRKAYEKNKEAKKEKMKAVSKKKLAEETPEQREKRLEKGRAYNKMVTEKRRAKKAEEKAKKAEAEPKPEPKPEPPKPKPKTKAGFIQKHEGETGEEIAARIAHNKAHFKKLREAKAEREKEDAEAKARAEAADVEAREREKATREKVLASEARPSEEGSSLDLPEYTGSMEGLVPPEPSKAEDMPLLTKPEPEKEKPVVAPVAKPKGKRELAKEAKQAETIRRLTEMAVQIEKDSHRRDVHKSMDYFNKLRREAGLPKTFYEEALEKRKATLMAGRAPPSYTPPSQDEHNLNRARAMIAAGGGGAMLPLLTGFVY